MRILAVDDNSAFLSSLEMFLEVDGHVVSAVRSAGEALELLTPDHRFDLVITDLRMPGIDGEQFLQRAVEQLSGAIPPFILLSSFVEEVGHNPAQLPWMGMVPKGQPDALRDIIDSLAIANPSNRLENGNPASM